MTASSGRLGRWCVTSLAVITWAGSMTSASGQAGKAARASQPLTGEPVLAVRTPEPLQFELALNELELDTRPSASVARAPLTLVPSTALLSRKDSINLLRVSGARGLADLSRITTELESANPDGDVGWVLYEPGVPRTAATRAVLTREIGLLVDRDVAVEEIVADVGPALPVPGVDGGYVVEARGPEEALELVERLQGRAGVRLAYSLLKRQMFTRSEAGRSYVSRVLPADPLLDSQWHLKGRSLEIAGANVHAAWLFNEGTGPVIGVVDDGLQHTHPDIQPNYSAPLSFDFNGFDPDPSPNVAADFHGTAAAGVAAARGGNGIGVSGAAPLATLAGIRLTAAAFSDAAAAAALGGHQPDAVHISSNSWGPSDNGITLAGPGPMTLAAMQTAATTGRSGLGRIFSWAGGNGNGSPDNCNFDGYANSRFVIAVGALADNGQQAFYSESCAALFVAAGSNGGTRAITTTDLVGGNGYNNASDYTNTFGGTSSATPLVSGSIALMLAQNPSLTARDVKHVLARTGVKVQPGDAGWSTGRYPHNEKFGFGLIDAGAAVSLAASWRTVLPEQAIPPVTRTVNLSIPDDNPTGITDAIVIGPGFSNFRVEHVEVVFSATHPWRGDLEVTLTSPAGTVSRLATERPNDSNDNFVGWQFGSVRHWDEAASGTWTLRVSDMVLQDTGVWQNWTLRIYGTQPTAPAGSRARSDFDGDGRLDFAIYRGGSWRVQNSPASTTWGVPSDIPVVGDYDGNGVSEIAIFRPADGGWYIQGQAPVSWGTPGDVPVPADYNGDGSDDLAIFRKGTWYVRGLFAIQWGVPGDIPVPGDYNGDGVDEIAVYRPSDGTWYINGGGTIVFGQISDIPVPADYDGDGDDDIALFQPSTANWNVMGQFIRQWGSPGDVPLGLDINADGRAELVAYRRQDATFRSQDTQTLVQTTTPFGAPGDLPALTPAWLRSVRAGDMDGDRRADPLIFRPSTGAWRALLSSTQMEAATCCFAAGDIPVPGHYLGFGRHQVAVFRPSDGSWIMPGAPTVFWGVSGDVPVPADYDGDSKTDIAVWRPGSGHWFLRPSSSPQASILFGVAGDIPVPGDYDGDRRTDVAIYRPSTGVWYVLRSSSNYTTYFAVSWGVTDDRPVPGDYDADGQTDIAVWRPSNGVWFRLLSSTNYSSFTTAQWGIPTDIPIAADYNGDGKTDVTVFRPASGTWFVLGVPPVVLGMNGDIPLPRTP